MRNAFTIFFLALLVAIQTPIGQFLKLPMLMEHFARHQERDGFSFSTFLQEHYASTHNDADLPEDEQLPFKTIIFYSLGVAIVPDAVEANALVHLTDKEKLFVPEPGARKQDSGSIFHPPRV